MYDNPVDNVKYFYEQLHLPRQLEAEHRRYLRESNMELVRNTQPDGKGNKYAVINLTKIEGPVSTVEELIAAIQANPALVEWGRKGEKDEHFVVKLKDQNADWALDGYANSAIRYGDNELAHEVREMTLRAGRGSPFCKAPD